MEIRRTKDQQLIDAAKLSEILRVALDREISPELRESLDQLLQTMENMLAPVAIATGQHTPISCSLPFHNHKIGVLARQCKNDSKHVFCRSHNLDKCVIHGCGGDLK